MNGISRKIYLEPEEPTEEDNRSDQKRIEEELKVRGVDATMTWQAMKKLYPLCEKADWKITVSLAWDEKNWKVVDLEAGTDPENIMVWQWILEVLQWLSVWWIVIRERFWERSVPLTVRFRMGRIF